MDGRIGVLVVDDEYSLRALWEKLLDAQPDMRCAGTLAQADSLCDCVERAGARVVLLDLKLPGLDPLEAVRRLAAERPECRVVICSGYSDHDTIRSAFDAGAWGFVDKLNPPMETLGVIRRVAADEVVFPPTFVQ